MGRTAGVRLANRNGTGKPVEIYYALPEHKRIVRAMAAYGIPQDAIAATLGIGRQVLRMHFADELTKATPELVARMATLLVKQAENGSVKAIIKILEARGYGVWTHRQTIEGGDPDRPVVMQIVTGVPRILEDVQYTDVGDD